MAQDIAPLKADRAAWRRPGERKEISLTDVAKDSTVLRVKHLYVAQKVDKVASVAGAFVAFTWINRPPQGLQGEED
jgi:hypothetical protein